MMYLDSIVFDKETEKEIADNFIARFYDLDFEVFENEHNILVGADEDDIQTLWEIFIQDCVKQGHEELSSICSICHFDTPVILSLLKFDDAETYECESYDRRLFLHKEINGIQIRYEFWQKGRNTTLTNYVNVNDVDYHITLDSRDKFTIEENI